MKFNLNLLKKQKNKFMLEQNQFPFTLYDINVIINALKLQKHTYKNAIKNCESVGGLENLISSYVYDIKEIETIINKLENEK